VLLFVFVALASDDIEYTSELLQRSLQDGDAYKGKTDVTGNSENVPFE